MVMRSPATRIVPSSEQLQGAWMQRRRPGWPATFEAVMADPLYAALVHMEAVRRVIAERRFERHLQREQLLGREPQPVPATRPSPRARPTFTGTDRKRAAANDRDD